MLCDMINRLLDVSKIIITAMVLIILSWFICIHLQIGPPSVEAIPFRIVSVIKGGTGANNASDARTNLGLEIGVNVQAQDDQLDDVAALSPGIGDIPYWSSATVASLLQFNASDVEGYILQATGAYADTVPVLVISLDITKLFFPNADNPTTETEAQCSWDTNNRALECFDDSSQLLSTMKKISVAVIPSPEALPVSIVTILDVHETAFPFGVVLKAAWIDCNDKPVANYVVVIEEWTDGNDNTIQAYLEACGTLTLTAGTDYENEITSFGSASIAAGNLVKADFDNTDWAAEQDLVECRIGVIYEIEDGN